MSGEAGEMMFKVKARPLLFPLQTTGECFHFNEVLNVLLYKQDVNVSIPNWLSVFPFHSKQIVTISVLNNL